MSLKGSNIIAGGTAFGVRVRKSAFIRPIRVQYRLPHSVALRSQTSRIGSTKSMTEGVYRVGVSNP
jgi:hypothetical protein